MSQFTDYLKILSLPKDFTSDQLKDNYRKLVKNIIQMLQLVILKNFN